MGDLNIDLLKYNIHSKTNNFVDNVFSQGLLPMIHKPIRLTFTCTSLIGHIYSNNLTQNSLSGIIITDISDHFDTFHIEHKKSIHHDDAIDSKHIYSKTNLHVCHFKEALRKKDVSSITNMNCPEEAYNAFITMYKT